MTEIQNSKRYDLEERTLNFAKRVIEFINKLPKTLTNIEISKQLIKSAGSVGTNYIEANEAYENIWSYIDLLPGNCATCNWSVGMI